MSPPRVIVVGAGVAGLAAGYRLQQRGFEVTVLEGTDSVGGKTAGVRRDGYSLNRGATVLAGSYDAMRTMAREVGVEDQFVTPKAAIGVVRDGKVHVLRGEGAGAIVDFVRTPLISTRSKLTLARMAFDLLRARKKASYDASLRSGLDTESVADYCDRKLNPEIRDHLLDPVLGGIFVVEGKKLSVADLWFTIWRVLLGGLLGYRAGMDFFARAVAAELDVRTGATVSEIRREDGGARVQWTTTEGAEEEHVDGVVLTVPAPQVPGLFPEIDPRLREILVNGLRQANFISIRLALSRRPDTKALLTVAGTGQLGGIATISYEHNLSPESAPEGKGLIGLLLYSDWATPRLAMTDEEILESVLPDLERVEPGVTDTIEFTDISRWAPAALNAVPGTHKHIAEIERLAEPRDIVQLAGDYRVMPSVNGAVVSGEIAAERLAATLGSRL